MAAGGLLAFIFAVAVIRFEANQVVAGFGINMLMLGVPALLSGALYVDDLARGLEGRAPLAPPSLAPFTWNAVFARIERVWQNLVHA